MTHGGIVGALLDETAGRTILMDGGFEDLMVTAKLEVVYRRPTPTGVPLLAVGRLVRRSGTRAEAEAELRLPDGTVTARATVLLARPPAEIVDAVGGRAGALAGGLGLEGPVMRVPRDRSRRAL